MKLLVVLLLVSSGVMADIETKNIQCKMAGVAFKDSTHLALKHVTVMSSITGEGLNKNTQTTSIILPFWPRSHQHGLLELKKAMDDFDCRPNPADIKCKVQYSPSGESLVKFQRTNDGKNIFTIVAPDAHSSEQMVRDFEELKICN